MIAIPRRRFLY